MASVVIEELLSKWSLEADTKPLDNLRNEMGGLMNTVKYVGLAVAGAAGSLFGLAKLTADAGDKALVASQKIGMNIEAFQELAYAAKLANVEQDEFIGAMGIFNKNMVAAAENGSELAKVYARIGVSVKGSNGQLKSNEQVLTELAGRFSQMPDGAEKSALAMQIFGRSGAKLIPFLNEGVAGLAKLRKEARDLGIVMDESTAKAADEFNDQMDRANFALQGVRNIVGAELIPIITELAKEFTAFVVANRQLIATKIKSWIAGLVVFLKIMWKFTSGIATAIGGLIEVLGGLENVLKFTALALGVFAAGKILYGIGAMILAIKGLAAAITMANLAALAIPILIGAAVVAVGLILEDLYQFFTGGESITGVMVDGFKVAFKWIYEKFSEFMVFLGNKLSDFANYFAGWFKTIISPFTWLLDKLGKLGVAGAAKIGNPFGDAPKTFGMKTGDNMGATMGMAPGKNDSVLGGNTDNSKSSNQKNQFNITQNITAGDGASALETGKEAGKQTENALDKVIRQSLPNFSSGEY